MMKNALTIVGILVLVAGLLWAAQGSGYFPYPAESFMISDGRWILRGLVTAGIGLALVVVSRRLR